MKRILSFGFKFIKRNIRLYISYIALSIIVGIIGITTPLILGKIIDLLSGKGVGFNLVNLVIVFAVFTLTKSILSFITSHQFLKLQSDSGYYSNIDIIEKLYTTSFKNISCEDPASLHQIINNDCNTITMFTISIVRDILLNLVNILFIMIIIYYQSDILITTFFIFIMCYIGVYLLFRQSLYKKSLSVKVSQTEFFSKLYNLVANIKPIKINGFFHRTINQQNGIFTAYQKNLKNQLSVSNLYDFVTIIISLIAQITLFLYGGNLVIDGKMNIGIFVIISGYFSSLLSSTDYFLYLGEQYQNVKSSYDRLMKYNNLPQNKFGKRKMKEISSIEFKDVKFSYNQDDYLFNVREKFEKGKIYWLRGNNGSGKTTFLNLLSGLFATDYQGEIYLNNITAKEIDPGHLSLHNISIVEQRPFILSESLKDNILCKADNLENGYQNEYKEYILSKLGLESFLNKLPNGLDTEFNSLIDSLSGGERQKITLARMFLSRADIWILDEPTSALDGKSKKNFYDLIEEARASRIIFIVSHEEVQCFDEIIIFDNTSKQLSKY